MFAFIDKFRKLREEHGIIPKLVENFPALSEFIEKRPSLGPILNKFKPQPLSTEDFVKDFCEQLSMAKHGTKIIIYSPFLSRSAVYKYLNYFKKAITNGAAITVHTLSPDSYGVRKKDEQRGLIETLRNNHIDIKERMNMHEKAVIIIEGDEAKIAYLGSLNVLSKYEGKADYMLKFTHPDIVYALHFFLEILEEHSEEMLKT